MADLETELRLGDAIKIWADVGLKVGGKLDTIESKIALLEHRLQTFTPVDYAAVASAVMPAGLAMVLNLGGPDSGTYWEVASISVGGVDVNTTAAGSCAFYVSPVPAVSGMPPGLPVTGMQWAFDHNATMPYTPTYGSRKVYVNDAEYLTVAIFAGTSGQVYEANAQITVYDSRAGGGRVVTDA